MLSIQHKHMERLCELITECPKLYRVHTFTLSDSTFPYVGRIDGTRQSIMEFATMERGMLHRIEVKRVQGTETLTQDILVVDHKPISLYSYFLHECELDFITLHYEGLKHQMRKKMRPFTAYKRTLGKVDEIMINTHTRTAIVDLVEFLFVGELYGSASCVIPLRSDSDS